VKITETSPEAIHKGCVEFLDLTPGEDDIFLSENVANLVKGQNIRYIYFHIPIKSKIDCFLGEVDNLKNIDGYT